MDLRYAVTHIKVEDDIQIGKKEMICLKSKAIRFSILKKSEKKVKLKTSFTRLVSAVCHSILSPLVTSQQDSFKTFELLYKYGLSLFLARIFSII